MGGITAALAVLSAIIVTGLIAGFNMGGWVTAYWVVVLFKYIMEDAINK